jgi:Tol biopolymer transport system component
MNPDTELRERLTRAASYVLVDPDRSLAALLQANQRTPRRRGAALMIAASVILVALGIVWRQTSREPLSFYQPPEPLSGVLALGRREPGGVNTLFRLEPATGQRAEIRSIPGSVTSMQWSPDGTRIAYTVEQGDGASYALVVADADGSSQKKLVEQDKLDTSLVGPNMIAVAWSPDGQRLAYSGRTIGRGRTVSVINVDGSNAKVLDGHWESVSWSPDGRHLLLDGWPAGSPEGRFDLYRARPDGTEFVRLTDDPEQEFNASWSPDGSQIVFAKPEGESAEADVDVFVMDADGSKVSRLTHDAWFDGVPAWSPDGDWIAFASNRDNHGEPTSVTETTSIFIMRADGSDVTRIVDGDGAVFPMSWKR